MSSSPSVIVASLERAQEAIATLIAVHAEAGASPDHKMATTSDDVASFQQAHSALLDLRALPLDHIEATTVQMFTDNPLAVKPPVVPVTASDALSLSREGEKKQSSKRRRKVQAEKTTKKAPPKKEKKRKRRHDVRLYTFAEDGFECALIDDGCKNPHETTKRRPHPLPPKDWYKKEDGTEMTREEKLNKRVCHSCYSKYWYRKNKAKDAAEAAKKEKKRKIKEVREEALAIVAMEALDK